MPACEEGYSYYTPDSGWPEGMANLSKWQVPHLGRVISQDISPLEDPDKGVRTTNRCDMLHQSYARRKFILKKEFWILHLHSYTNLLISTESVRYRWGQVEFIHWLVWTVGRKNHSLLLYYTQQFICDVCSILFAVCNVLFWGAHHSLSTWKLIPFSTYFIFQVLISEVRPWMVWAWDCILLRGNVFQLGVIYWSVFPSVYVIMYDHLAHVVYLYVQL